MPRERRLILLAADLRGFSRSIRERRRLQGLTARAPAAIVARMLRWMLENGEPRFAAHEELKMTDGPVAPRPPAVNPQSAIASRQSLIEPSFSPDGVDLTLIRWMLSLSPCERLAVAQAAAQSILRLRDAQSRS